VTHQFISSDLSRYNPKTICLNIVKCILAQQTEELCSEFVPLLEDEGPTHSKSGPPEILCKHSCLPNYTAYTNHWGLTTYHLIKIFLEEPLLLLWKFIFKN